ncbi:hypothetical protein ACQPZX_11590 [Actinoplanes sp. CA-142083]|uniref:hypothetical protein n=1 Tax=Actinoplanes sp. CA-142083 TaxID=3239903 RepID=UPI003D8F35B8
MTDFDGETDGEADAEAETEAEGDADGRADKSGEEDDCVPESTNDGVSAERVAE